MANHAALASGRFVPQLGHNRDFNERPVLAKAVMIDTTGL